MAWTQDEYLAAKQALNDLVAGKRKTRFVIDGDVVEYSAIQLPELRSLVKEMEVDVAASDTESGTISGFCITGSKGL